MPMKNAAGGCKCCGSGCTKSSFTASTVTTSGTETVGGISYAKFDLATPSNQHLLVHCDQAKFIIMRLSNGDRVRIEFPAAPSSGGLTLTIDRSTDGGVTWTKETDLYSGDPADTYFYEVQCGNESPALAADYVADAYIHGGSHAAFIGNNSNGSYIGIENRVAPQTNADDVFTDIDDSFQILDGSGGRGTFLTNVSSSTAGVTITSAYALRSSSSDMTVYSTLFDTYDGYNCATEDDPNCSTMCSGSFPSMSLTLESVSWTVAGAAGKTVTIDGSFAASDGYCQLNDAGFTRGNFTDGVNASRDYVADSQPEWSGVGITREAVGNSAAYTPIEGGVPANRAMCAGVGQIRAKREWQQVDDYCVKEPIGFGLNTYRGSGAPFTSEYSWTANGSGFGLTDFSVGISSTYDGSLYDETTHDTIGGDARLSVASENDCSITFELEITDDKLQHCDPADLAGKVPDYDATITGVSLNGFFATNFAVDLTNTYTLPWVSTKFMGSKVLTDTVGAYQSKTSEYASHALNAGVDESEVSEDLPDEPTSSQGMTVTYTGTRSRPFAPWRVTFRKTVTKASLGSGPTTLTLTSADIHSSNYTPGNVTALPPSGSGWSVVSQMNALSLGSQRPYLLAICKRDSSLSTTTTTESDWSASVTFNAGPYYS